MSGQQAIVAMADGNPGAVSVMVQMLQKGDAIDPQAFMGGGLSAILFMDTLGIYGSDIWILYKNVCGQSLNRTMGLLRAVQMGILSQRTLNNAVQACGGDGVLIAPGPPEPLVVEDVISSLKEKLPSFVL